MKIKKQFYIVLYYLVLLLLLTSRANAVSEPPMVIRMAFVFVTILPCLIYRSVSYSAVITFFYTLGHYGLSYSYMPYMIYIYGILTLMMTIVLYKNKQGVAAPPQFLVLFTIYVFIIDFITGWGDTRAHFPEDVDWCFLMLLCFFFTTNGNIEISKKQFSIAFAVITVVLSLLFLIYRNDFLIEYQNSGLERSGWADPNYYGMVIGVGVVVGVHKMLSKEWKHLLFAEKNLYRAVLILSIPTLALNASRGAFLSVIVGSVIILLYSKSKKEYKIAFTFVALAAIVWLYQNQYFDLLEYRFMNDDGTGSDRSLIWMRKLQLYAQGNIIQWIFGFGYTGGFYITGVAGGFHNEFLAILVDYGITGLVFFLYMLFYPFELLSRGNSSRPIVIALVFYLITCFFTLEPLTHALMMFFSLYFWVVLLAIDNTDSNSQHV